MSVAPLLVGAVQTSVHTSQFGGIGGTVLVYVGCFVLWGLIGIVPLLAKEPAAEKPTPLRAWTVVDSAEPEQKMASQLKDASQTIDGDFAEVREPPQLPGQDPRWGR
jgi:hypothetical protein